VIEGEDAGDPIVRSPGDMGMNGRSGLWGTGMGRLGAEVEFGEIGEEGGDEGGEEMFVGEGEFNG